MFYYVFSVVFSVCLVFVVVFLVMCVVFLSAAFRVVSDASKEALSETSP